MRFIGREHEMMLLEREYAREESFVLMTGRRRVGKTRLLKEFAADRNPFYFMAADQNEAYLLKDFSAALSVYTGRTFGTFADWKSAFTAYVQSAEGHPLIILDEFQNMFARNKDFVGIFQVIWDEILSGNNVMLVICGSHITMLESLHKDRNSPLYGRFTRHITLSPLSFEDVRGIDGLGFRDALERYAVLGGVPKYMELFDDGPLRDNVLLNVMEPSSVLYDDPRVLLDNEFNEPSTYMAIMRAVADGNRKLSDISSAIQVPSTTLTTYLTRLSEIRMLERSVPVTDDPEKSKNGLYSVCDRYTAFWFRFVRPFQSELQWGVVDGAIARFDGHFVDSHVSFVFEDVSRGMVRRMSDAIGFTPERVGRYWGNHVEIDIVAISNIEKRIFMAECKYHRNTPVDIHVLNALRKKSLSFPDMDRYEITFGLFSVSGFDERVLRERDVVLVDCGEIVEHRCADRYQNGTSS